MDLRRKPEDLRIFRRFPDTSEGILKASEIIFLLIHVPPPQSPKVTGVIYIGFAVISIIEQVNTFPDRLLEFLTSSN